MVEATRAPADEFAELPFRPQPNTLEETGIGIGPLTDLCLKTIYFEGRLSAREIARLMALSFNVVEGLLTFLKREKLVEIVGAGGLSEQQYEYVLTDRGAEKAAEAMERNQYRGPAPVSFQDYADTCRAQTTRDTRVDHATLDASLKGLSLDPMTRRLVGPAVNSGRSLLLYGEPGNGKSSIAKAIGRMIHDAVLIPHAIDVNGQIIVVFDPRIHQEVFEDPANDRRARPPGEQWDGVERRRDRRWVVAKRPFVVTGGELTLADLELKYSPQSKFYIAPLQMRANCGILLIDDFGRQLVRPKELLNRWIVPMEDRTDHLSLLSGEAIEVPFELLLIFSTNIPPKKLGDEAFFRRIRHKIEVGDPTEEGFFEILRTACGQKNVPYSDEGAWYLIQKYYRPTNRPFRGVHPRDLIDLMLDVGRFEGRQPSLSPEWVDIACASYFVDEDAGVGSKPKTVAA